MGKPTEVVTFKIDKKLAQLMRGVANRSEFIRNAILSALENACPVCKGSGVLAEHRKKHWDDLVKQLEGIECRSCQEIKYIVPS